MNREMNYFLGILGLIIGAIFIENCTYVFGATLMFIGFVIASATYLGGSREDY